MKKKIGIIICSYNNYILLENETLINNNFYNFPIINIDDHSNKKNQIYGRKLCKKNNIEFQINKKKGVQFATDQGINYLKKKYNCEWVIILQQDNFFLTKNFLKKFEKKIKNGNYKDYGALGFNQLSEDSILMNKNILKKFYNKEKPKGSLCVFSLSSANVNIFKRVPFMYFIKSLIKSLIIFKSPKKDLQSYILSSRIFSPFTNKAHKIVSKLYNGIFECELPMWSTIAINTNIWKKYVKPRKGYIFHIWFNDIAYQLLYNNIKLAVDSNLYIMNNQKIKEKYNFHWSSAHVGREKNSSQVEKYGHHLKVFKKYWGFDYENPEKNYDEIKKKYPNTLIEKFLCHDYTKGPMNNKSK